MKVKFQKLKTDLVFLLKSFGCISWDKKCLPAQGQFVHRGIRMVLFESIGLKRNKVKLMKFYLAFGRKKPVPLSLCQRPFKVCQI